MENTGSHKRHTAKKLQNKNIYKYKYYNKEFNLTPHNYVYNHYRVLRNTFK